MRRILGMLTALVTALLVFGPAPSASAAPGTPVIFVHGFGGGASNWNTAMSVFRAAGYPSNQLFTYNYNSYGSNVSNAQGLASYVSQVKSRTGASKVDIVNHSMGGLVSQYYLKVLNGNPNVDHLASIAGANHGTTYAAGCIIYITCQQMYPGSSFISQITFGDETPGSTKYGTWYSACDGIIIPYTSTRLSGATNNNVGCETHLGFLGNTSVLSSIAAFFRT
ncbi:lipase [Actinomadura craniellae]|uniref:Lipase n=1 Tax=Actinomadura craniellae TaxID=2231787 RepID=A0A365H6B6_9ACTN|nr:alpha/beta fold hydrolase [Actinomadura craniellae]RAY14621.1 lipase [Actinomadura craniellae]